MPKAGRTIIFNTRWMTHYAGPEDDLPRPNFSYLRENTDEIGGELINFLPFRGHCRGYVQIDNDHINLERVDPSGADSDAVDGVLVVFTATPAVGKTRLVGWYEDAVLHRHRKDRRKGEPPFSADARADRSFLIPPAERVFDMRKGEKRHQGQRPVCYISQLNPEFDEEIVRYIESVKESGLQPVGALFPEGASGNRRGRGRPRNADPVLRREVEEAAVGAVSAHYEERGHDVWSVETENIGWDLETDQGIRIEVKGRRSPDLAVELTPNEYAAMLRAESDPDFASLYRVAVVTNALEQPGKLHLFEFSDGQWACPITGIALAQKPLTGVRLSAAESQ